MIKVQTTRGSLYASYAPFQKDLDGYRFDIIWNLAEELSSFSTWEIEYTNKVLLGNIPDYDIPPNIEDFKLQLNEVALCLKNNGKVLVHCLAGHGRTGMAVACLLSILEGYEASFALQVAKKLCHGPETDSQINFVLSLLNNYEV